MRKQVFRCIFNMASIIQFYRQTSDADPDPDLRIQICIIKVGSGSVWKDTNPDLDPGHEKCAETSNGK